MGFDDTERNPHSAGRGRCPWQIPGDSQPGPARANAVMGICRLAHLVATKDTPVAARWAKGKVIPCPLPGCQVTAHLLIPGFVHTPLTRPAGSEKPAAAWSPEQTVDFMLESLDRGDFYILCPDNDVPRALDQKRIAWAAGDIIENRPALSRWHPDWAERFAAYIADQS